MLKREICHSSTQAGRNPSIEFWYFRQIEELSLQITQFSENCSAGTAGTSVTVPSMMMDSLL